MAMPVRALTIHLRLRFQLALSGVFLWGVYLSSGRFDWRTSLAWVAFTVGLSGGATAFNSFYDEDRGPVGGLRHPPPVTAALLPFSLAVLAAGFVLAFLAGPMVAAIYTVAAAILTAYSHPWIRTKRRPWASMATVGTGSGALCLWAGALAASGGIPQGAQGRVALGLAAAFLTLAGFYPLTQIGQIDEDRERGDRTFAVAYGRDAAFRWALPVLALAALINAGLTAVVLGAAAGSALAACLLALGWRVMRWRRDPSADAMSRSDSLTYTLAAVHVVFVVWRAFTA